MYKNQIKNNFKSHLNHEQRLAIKITQEFDKRKERISHSTNGYHKKIKTVPDFELEPYDCGESLESMVKSR